MDYSSDWALVARRVGQRLGIIRPAIRLLRKLSRESYEAPFDLALMNSLRPGDCVWDVGANVGFYSRKAAEAVGPTGTVVSFEPSPGSIARLRSVAAIFPQLKIEPVALSEFEGDVDFYTSEDSVTDSLFAGNSGSSVTKVRVCRGDKFCHTFPPNVIKIDVEGSELDVIRGLQETLTSPSLRAIFIEVHFLELAKRGLSNAPATIRLLLKQNGFAIRWIDSSHIAATRV